MNLRTLVPFRDRGVPARQDLNLFGSLQREIDRLFEDFTQGIGAVVPQQVLNLVPRVDVAETDKEIVITAEMPGLERRDVEISLEDNVLTIRGEKRIEEEDSGGAQAATAQDAGNKASSNKSAGGKASEQSGGQNAKQAGNGQGKNKNYHISERSYGVFLRVFELPPGIDESKIQATMSNGVLKVVIPKQAQSTKKIEVKEAA